MTDIYLTNKQARRFLLLKHGLIGDYKFTGKQGILDYINQAGCIQFDPIDVCGKNPELVLQSRVKGFTKQMLYDLLYQDRELIDYFDKNLAIISVYDWKYFSRYRDAYKYGRSYQEINSVCGKIKEIIKEKGAVSSADLDFKDTVKWYWSDTKLSRAALETMYFRGELIIHHKKGSIKYYELTENFIPSEIINEPEPFSNDFEYMKWHVLRRISGIGLLWNKPSDGWLNIPGLKAKERNEIFNQLVKEEKIIEITVEDMNEKLYCESSDYELLEAVKQEKKAAIDRCELLAPLDNMLWDRKLIKALFDFDYKWEIYKPVIERKYGYYVLPILYGDRLIGRIEAVCNRKEKVLLVKNIWYEKGIKKTKKMQKALDKCLNRFAKFNGCEDIQTEG